MSNRSKDILIALVYSLMSLAYVLFFETIVFDDSYDSFVNNISIGQFTPFPMMQQHYLSALVSRDVLIFIQKLVPEISVFATSYVLFNVLSLLFCLYTVYRYLLANSPAWLKHLTAIILCLIFLENIVSITHTRFATIFCGIALINLLRPQAKQWFWVAMFVFGMLMRPESGIGALIVIGLGAVCFEGKVLETGRKFFYPLISIIILLGIFFIHRSFTDRFEILIEPDIEYALSTNRISPLGAMLTKEDSIKHNMATYGILIDESFTDIAFLREISNEQFSFNLTQLQSAVAHVLSFSAYYPVFLVFALMALVMSPLKHKGRLILYYLTIVLVLSYLDYNIALSDRHYASIQVIAMFWPLKVVINGSSARFGIFSVFMVLGVVVSAGVTCGKAIANQRDIASEVACIESGMNHFEAVYQHREVMIGVSSFHLLDRRFSFTTDAYNKNNYSLYDAMNYSIVPINIAYLNSLCSCEANKPGEFFQWLAEAEAIILMDKQRKRIIQEYLDYSYKGRFTLQLDKGYEALYKPDCLAELSINDYFPWIVKVN